MNGIIKEVKIKEIKINEIEGILVGNAEDKKAATGCTAIICPEGAVAGVDVRGGGPATRETDLLKPVNMVEKINCVMLSGGSAFGLAAGDGAMQFLEEKGVGFETGFGAVPIVCGASLFDLAAGDSKVRPDKEMGYKACRAAYENDAVMQGNHGAGTGASVGKILGPDRVMKGGLGIYAGQVGDVKCAAIVAVNCLGDVFDTETGKMIAGVLNEEKNAMLSTSDIMLASMDKDINIFQGNTTIGCIVTNAKLTKTQCTKLASIVHNAYARAISPVHTSADGDTVFVMSTGDKDVMPDALSVFATLVMEKAIANAVKNAETAYGIPAALELLK